MGFHCSRPPDIIRTLSLKCAAHKATARLAQSQHSAPSHSPTQFFQSKPNFITPKRRDYLFSCLDKREDVQNRAYGTDHLAMCVEDSQGVPIFVVDLDTGKDQSKILKPVQIKSVRNLLNKMVVVFGQ